MSQSYDRNGSRRSWTNRIAISPQCRSRMPAAPRTKAPHSVMLRRPSLRSERLLRVAWLSAVRLHEHAIDLLEVERVPAREPAIKRSVADTLDEGCEAQVSCVSENSFGGAYDECEGFCREGRVRQSDLVELGVERGHWFPFRESAHRLGGELGDECRVRDATLQVFVCAECERRQKAWLRNEDQVVVFRFRCCSPCGEVLEEKTQSA